MASSSSRTGFSFCSNSNVKPVVKFNAKTTAEEIVKTLNVTLTGKVILITGGTSGLGTETARTLAKTGARIIVTARDAKKGAEVVENIRKTTGNQQVEVMELDLASLSSVKTFAAKFRLRNLPINILICNAGIMACPYTKTVDGFESQFAVNHLAHFYLVHLLLPQLKAGKPARVVVVSSVANLMGPVNFDDINWEKGYDRWAAYAQSKTANVLFAKQLNKLYSKDGILAFSLHPGVIRTNLQQHMPIEELKAYGLVRDDGTYTDLWKTIPQGAATSVYGALAPELVNHGGEHLEDAQVSRGLNTTHEQWGLAPHAADMNNAQRLWDVSEKLLGLK